MEKIFPRIKKLLQISDFYKCLFVTYDAKTNQIIPANKSNQAINYVWLVLHLIHWICQVISVMRLASTSTLPQLAIGIILTLAYTMGFVWRIDLKRDPILAQVWNFIAARNGICT